MKFVIYNTDDDSSNGNDLLWSKRDGWVNDDFDVFFEEEVIPNWFELPAEIYTAGYQRSASWQLHESNDNTDGQTWYVGVYSIRRCYGGPEEGGWWYDSGDLMFSVRCFSEESADDLGALLREKFPRTGKRYSVLGGYDFEIKVGNTFPIEHFPTNRPHYE